LPNKTLLVIGLVWPEPKSTAAGSRMLQLIAQFQQHDYNIVFASTAAKTSQSFNLEALNISTVVIQLNNSSFDDFIKQLQPDAVLFDRFITEEQFGWRIAEHCPNAIRVLDTEDFHGLRKGRAAALKANLPFSLDHLQNDTTKREVASIYRCDISLMISEVEIDILVNQLHVDASLLYYLPFLIEDTAKISKQKLPMFAERQYFVTIGNFLHAPNYDAVCYLKTTIWPLIRKDLPKAQLHIYGAYPSQKVSQLHNDKDGFIIKGFAENVNDVMQNAKVCLAALRFGAGLKGKLVDAMQNGTPCMMSTIAAEGMFGDMDPNGFVEDSPTVFVQKAVELYINTSVWEAKQQQGFKVLTSRFEASLFAADFQDKIVELSKALQEHRQKNFIGQLLMHHSMQSTKYLSKWIEAKESQQ